MATLITPEEVKLLSRIDRHVSPCDINDIKQVERAVKRNCLGDIYDALVADLNDYSAVPLWDGTSVPIDTVRLYKGIYYVSLSMTTSEPSNKSFWAKAPKFNTAANELLWCEVLGRYIALLVLQNTQPILSTPIKAQGTVKLKGEGFDAATEDENLRLQTWIASQVATAYDNLDEYLTENFPSYAGDTCTANCCTEPQGTFIGGIYFPPECVEEKSCNCKKCREAAISKANRYVIA